MALSEYSLLEIRASAAAGNVNGGGFNPQNANFITDLACDANTGNTASPIVSSATYTFVAADVGAWVYVKSGTNWTPGMYQVASVAAGKATLSAAIGAAVQYFVLFAEWKASVIIGCATVGTPTGGTFGIDYSQQDTAESSITDLAIDGAVNTKVTSAALPFGPEHVGNFLHITAGTNFTQGWYEVVSVAANVATLDRAAGTAGATGGTAYLGGAMSLNSSLDDDMFEIAVSGSNMSMIWYVKSGSYLLGETVSMSLKGNQYVPFRIIGYNSVRGDNPTGDNRPLIDCGALIFGLGDNVNGWWWDVYNMRFTGTGTSVLQTGYFCKSYNVKSTNTSGTAGRYAINAAGLVNRIISCEAQSDNGTAIYGLTSPNIIGCYIHDSVTGVNLIGGGGEVINNIIAGNSSYGIYLPSINDSSLVHGNTIYGSEGQLGTGIWLAAGRTGTQVINNLFYGLVKGIETGGVVWELNDSNCFFNCGTNSNNWGHSRNDLFIDPEFVDAAAGNWAIGENLKAQGIPGTFSGSTTTAYVDIGGVQRQEAGGGLLVHPGTGGGFRA